MGIRRFTLLAVVAVLTTPLPAAAQGTRADYDRAWALTDRFEGLLTDAPETPGWIDGTSGFWYRKAVTGGNEFIRVDATSRQKQPAFDHIRLAAALSAARDTTYSAKRLPFNRITFVDGGNSIEFAAADSLWRCSLADYACRRTGPAPRGFGRGGGPGQSQSQAADQPRVSPDGKWEAVILNFNVHVRAPGLTETIALSADGSEGNAYRLQSIVWSPDSRKLAAYRVRPGYTRIVRYIESSPDDQLQPAYMEREYAKPGDALDVPQPVLFDVAARSQLLVDNTLFPNPYNLSRMEWRKDSRAFTFEYNQRGHQVYRIIEVDAATGGARAVISEEPETFFYYRNATGSQTDSGTRFRFDVDDGREVIWMSERDGWSHLYLFDGVTGRLKNPITRGEWVVRGVDSVDVGNRHIWFRAGGMEPGQDPYFIHYYRINFDGTGLVRYTEADGNHTVVWSPDHEYYVDTWSRVDLAPVSELRRSRDRSLVMELERGDFSALLATGWRPPEVFVSKARDGVTDIWGVIFRPTNFDPGRSYPVIENIYAGPQGSFVPKSFSVNNGMRAQAELGFIVVQVDGMGTANRSKAFHDVIWRDLGDAGFPDRILWHKAIAAKYPQYDISRVGIYGTSAGGQNSMGGLLFHPEFYKAAVSAAGCHDNRMDKIWWNELWMGWPLGPHYEASSNMVNAHRLKGNLLLVVGEMDTNVDPSSTMQVANALIKAGKYFDLLYIPGAGHGPGGAYGERKRFDFFVQHLIGVTPPAWNADEPVAGSGFEDGAQWELPDEVPGTWSWTGW